MHVFMPQMIAQCRDPEGEKVFSKNGTETTVTEETLSSKVEKTKIATMEQEILSLKEQLRENREVLISKTKEQ